MDSSVESSDVEGSLKKCFDVYLPRDFNPNITPSTGEEYLQLAIYEAKHCKSIVRVDLNSKKINQETNYFDWNADNQQHLKLLLPWSWKSEKILEFTRFRNYIEKNLKKLPEKRKPMFNLKSRLKYYPTFSDVISLPIPYQSLLLELIIQELYYVKSGSTISNIMGCWIYTILTLLEIPLSPSLHGILRELAKQCCVIRSKLPGNMSVDMCASLNLIICIIGLYYEQYDLADNYTA